MTQPPRYPRRAAAPVQLRTRTELRAERRRLPSSAPPAAFYWQGFHYVELYDPAHAQALQPARALSASQAAALEAGRALIGTTLCRGCKTRVDRCFLDRAGLCESCVAEAVQAEIEAEWQAVHAQAATLLAQSPLFLDTETTGIDDDAEPIEVAVIDVEGTVLLDSLVKPRRSIPAEAQAVNGLSDADVAHAPAWPDVAALLGPLLTDRFVIGHHADFDRRIITRAYTRHDLSPITYRSDCTMELLTGLNGARWPNLGTAAALAGAVRPTEMHRARADAETCRLILIALSASTGGKDA
ncbi:Phage protein [Candidatus Burkholderia brachyanthoides]|nr:Phage protein [Candidatus Burkholderia brachyanthoides]